MNVFILLSSLALMVNAVLSQIMPLNDVPGQNDSIAELKEMMREQLIHFDHKLQQQKQDFDQKLQEHLKESEKLRERFNQAKEKQDQLQQYISLQCEDGLNKPTEQSGRDNDICKPFLDDKSIKKRSDDTDPLHTVVEQLSQRVDDVTANIQSLRNEDQVLNTAILQATDSLYTHWGSSTCSNTSQLVYSGIMGGSYYSHSGGATNPLCLPLTPDHFHTQPHSDVSPAALYGAEYEVHPMQSHNLDVVCSVCHSSKATTVMIPAKNSCYPGWTLQYTGYIMADQPLDGRSGTEYTCVDTKLEGRPGSGANLNGLVIYLTQAHCGSLPCPPYKAGEVIGCVVCSK